MGTEKRERQKAARQQKIQELRRAEDRSTKVGKGLKIGGAIVAFVIFAVAFALLTRDDSGDEDVATDDTTSEDTAPGDSTPESTESTEAPPTTEAAVIPGPTECPAADGSSERTLDFEGTFDNCLTEGVDYQARFVTTEGEILVDLLETTTPNTVNNFVALARYHYYDGTKIFRTDPSIDIIQGGSPHTDDNADPGPGYTIPDEGGAFTTDASGNYTGPFTYQEGQLIMARSAGPDSSSAQYFFSTGPNVSLLDGQGTYLLLGEVIEGLDVLQTIIGLHQADDSGLGGVPSRDVVVESVEILEAA